MCLAADAVVGRAFANPVFGVVFLDGSRGFVGLYGVRSV